STQRAPKSARELIRVARSIFIFLSLFDANRALDPIRAATHVAHHEEQPREAVERRLVGRLPRDARDEVGVVRFQNREAALGLARGREVRPRAVFLRRLRFRRLLDGVAIALGEPELELVRAPVSDAR